MSKKEVRAYRNLSASLVKIQERGKLINTLIAKNVGFREEEEFVRSES